MTATTALGDLAATSDGDERLSREHEGSGFR
jgi:hypothetical protein